MAIQLSGSLAITGSLTTSGQVGIGTLSPITNLHIASNTNTGLRINATAFNGSAELDLLSNGTQNAFLDYGPNQLRFRSTNSDMSAIVSGSVLVLNNNGNVGIGTESPTQKLTVFGSTLLSGSSVSLNLDSPGLGNGDISFNGSTFTIVSNSSSAPLVLSTNSTERMRITSGGNVGIGATSPSFRLDVNGQGRFYTNSDSVVDILMLYNISSTSAGVRQRFQNGYGDLAAIKVSQRDNGSLADDGIMEFQVASNTSLDTKMSILNTGNVGIGTTSPGKILNVAVNDSTAGNYQARNAVVRIQNTNDAAANSRFAGVQFSFSPGASTGDNYVIGAVGAVLTDSSTQWSGDLVFAVKEATTSTALTEYMRIATGGNVSIGTTSTGALISGTERVLRVAGSNLASLYLESIGNRIWSNYVNSAGTLTWYDITGATTRMVINSSGNVGIGTSSPSAELQVGKSSDVTIAMSNSSSVTSGNRGGISWYNSSVSTVANIRAVAVTDNVGTELQFYTRPAAGSLTQVFTLASTGTATFTTSENQGGLYVTSAQDNTTVRVASTATGGQEWRIQSTGGTSGLGQGKLIFKVGGTETAANIPLTLTTDNSTNGGRVGIGTTSPGDKLDVVGNITLNAGYKFYNGAANNSAGIDFDSSYVNLSGYNGIRFFASNTGVGSMTQRMFLNSSGNLGIGTATPRTKAEFSSGLPTSIPTRTNTTSGIAVTDGGAIYGRIGVADLSAGGVGYPTYIQAGDWDGASYYNILLNPLGGNVGIGTTDPSGYRLKVQNTGTTGISIQTVGSDSGNPQLQMLNGSTDTTIAATSNGLELTAYSSHALLLKTVNVERMRITSGGDVGIGTTSPSRKLDVLGNTRVYGSSGSDVTFTLQSQGSSAPYLILNGSLSSYNLIRFQYAGTDYAGIGAFNGDITGGLSFYTNGISTERMRITSGGNVGIGTSSPFGTATDRTVLSVNGTTDVSLNVGTGGSQRAYLYAASSYADLGTIGALPLVFSTNNNEKMRITSGGNVGIGTTAPEQKTHIRGDEGQPGTTGTTQNGILRVHASSTEGWGETLDMGMHVGISGPASYAWLQATNNSNLAINYRLCLNPNGGDVGIGTTSPSYRLDVNGGSSDTTLRVQTTGQNPVRLRLTNEERDFILTNNPGDDLLSFFYADANRLQFNTTNQWFNSGNVGIGTTSPSTKLHVAGIITAATTSNSGRINFGSEDTTIAIYRDNAYDLVIQQDASSGSPIYISGAGNVVISIDSNNNQTDCAFIVGSNAIKSVNTLFSVNESGNATVAGTLTELSSIRYKENIENIKYGLDKVVQLRGVTYTKKDTGVKEIGLIAEEVESILPDLILRNPEGEADSISYSRITAVLIEAIKELKIEIEELKANR